MWTNSSVTHRLEQAGRAHPVPVVDYCNVRIGAWSEVNVHLRGTCRHAVVDDVRKRSLKRVADGAHRLEHRRSKRWKRNFVHLLASRGTSAKAQGSGNKTGLLAARYPTR